MSPRSGKLAEYRRKRDFTKTAEPAGEGGAADRGTLAFVIQKHAASHLHYDLRLELDGVMKSWAVPKGPSVNPAVKRLAMEVEDHPMAYNAFEGTIPKGEYGGGTVMLWDQGTYTADEAGPHDDPQKVLRREHRAGKISFSLEGMRLRGSWALVRTDTGPKPKWLLIKHRDAHARRHEATEEFVTSVTTGRTMEEIAEGSRVWHSNRATEPASGIRPQRPATVRRLPADEDRVYMAWRGGERVLAYATPEACVLVDGSGSDRTGEYADIAASLAGLARRSDTSFVLDGEIAGAADEPELSVLDLLFAGDAALAPAPWSERRMSLEKLFRRRRVPGVTVNPTLRDPNRIRAKAEAEEWAGFLAIDPESSYTPGERTRDWLLVTV